MLPCKPQWIVVSVIFFFLWVCHFNPSDYASFHTCWLSIAFPAHWVSDRTTTEQGWLVTPHQSQFVMCLRSLGRVWQYSLGCQSGGVDGVLSFGTEHDAFTETFNFIQSKWISGFPEKFKFFLHSDNVSVVFCFCSTLHFFCWVEYMKPNVRACNIWKMLFWTYPGMPVNRFCLNGALSWASLIYIVHLDGRYI